METENMLLDTPSTDNEQLADEEYFTLKGAEKYTNVSDTQISALVRAGGLPGTIVGESTAEGFRIPKSALDAAMESGQLRRKRAYHKRRNKVQLPVEVQLAKMPARMTIKEAAERFGIGYSTLQAKVYHGVVPTEEVQIGPNSYKKYVRAEDVAKLPIQKGKGNLGRPRPTMATKIDTAKLGQDLAPIADKSDLTSELLRAADMVRDGKYRVAKLSFALEFTGGE